MHGVLAYMGGAAAGGSFTGSTTKEPMSPSDHTTGDAPTPNRPTTSACCRPKRTRRHRRHATRDSAWRQQAFVGGVSDADAAHHFMPQRPLQAASGSETPPTAFATSQPKTPCRPVVSPKTHRRRSNPLPCQPLRLLSPETREATKVPARKFAREATTAAIAPLLQWATCRQPGHLFSPFKDHP
jgi:hypothetical protein